MRVKTLSLTVLAISTFFSYSYANDCASISDDKERLTCYDQLNTSTVKKQEGDTGKWIKSERVSPIDDSPTVVLALESPDKAGSGFRAERPILIVRCQENRTSLYIDWGAFITTGKTRIVTRIDKEKAKTETWSVSSDNTATFSPTPIPLIKDLLGKSSLIVQVTPFSDNTYTVNFDIKGLDNAITPVREACGW